MSRKIATYKTIADLIEAAGAVTADKKPTHDSPLISPEEKERRNIFRKDSAMEIGRRGFAITGDGWSQQEREAHGQGMEEYRRTLH